MTDATPAAPATTAAYLAKRMIAERGFRPGTVPEAEALLAAADIVLTRADGMNLQLLLIVDREADASRRFALPLDALVAVGERCGGYSGTINGTRLPVLVTVWEVGPDAGAEPEFTRLRALARNWPGKAKVVVSAWTFDTAAARVRTTARFGGRLGGRGYLERVLREPRRPDHELVPKAPAAVADAGAPWLTWSMLAVLVLVFAGEHLFAVAPWHGPLGPDILTLIALGGLSHDLVDGGQWYRLFTATTLHADIFHLLLNAVALTLGGVVLEGLFGRAWLLALFMLGALGGSLLSYALNPAELVSVGASGAIMGLLAAAFISSFRLPEGPQRVQVQSQMMQVLIPSMLPLAIRGGAIDYAAHLGGALTGSLVGLVLLRTWPVTEPLPRFRGAARVLGLAGLLALAFGFTRVALDRDDYTHAAAARDLLRHLIPDPELPRSDAEMVERAADLVARFPRDPRAHLADAFRLARAADLEAAAQTLRRGLDEREILATIFPDRTLETAMRALLAEILLTQGQPDAAREAAAPVCAAGPGGAVPDPLRPLDLCR